MQFASRTVVYSNTVVGVTVFRARLLDSGLEVAVKEQNSATIRTANDAINESLNQAKIDHPNVCKIYRCYLDSACKQGFRSVIVMEWMEKDVFMCIKERQPQAAYWREEELWRYMSELIEALAYAQSRGISHRDIKPQNIFLNSQGEIKIGDFGSSKWQTADINQQSIQGTPFFLSPILRNHYKAYIASGSSQVLHNQYKSDVYSLGLTLLFMAELKEPKELMSIPTLEQKTAEKLGQLRYSPRVVDVLRLMLAVEEDRRPDFLALVKIVNSQQRSGLDRFRSEIAAPSQAPLDAETTCPRCLQRVRGECQCGNSASVDRRNAQTRVDCMMCSQEFQAGKEQWRNRLASAYKREVSEFSSLCSESCVTNFLNLLNEGAPECGLCRARCDASKPRVPLPCSHCFCSKLCFLQYVMRCTYNFTVQGLVRCPVCLEVLDTAFLQRAFEGRMEQEVQHYRSAHCTECSSESAGRQAPLPCQYHFLCGDCESSVFLAGERMHCRYCNVSVPLEEYYGSATSS